MEKSKKIKLAIIASLLAISITIIILPKQANAQAIDATIGIMLSNFVKPVTQYIFDLFKQMATGLIYLLAAGYLLKTTLNMGPQMIDTNSLFVKTGLNITMTIADILLIAVFIAIALGSVFNIESINAKKNLIKFFFAALLIHFSPLFVGMLTDITNIINSSIMVGSGDVFSTAVNALSADIFRSALTLAGIYVGGAVSSAVYGWNMIAGLAFVTGLLVMMVTVIPQYLIQIMVMETITGILFSYGMFFLTRIFMIQILTVLAPLAILASVLPQTYTHFKTWLSWLIGWSFGGTLMLFLLTLGLSSTKMIVPSVPQYAPQTFSTYTISYFSEGSFYWIALAIYMLAAESICAAMIPALSGKISNAVSGGMGKMGGSIGKGVMGNKKNPGLKQGVDQRIEKAVNDYRSSRVPTDDLRDQ